MDDKDLIITTSVSLEKVTVYWTKNHHFVHQPIFIPQSNTDPIVKKRWVYTVTHSLNWVERHGVKGICVFTPAIIMDGVSQPHFQYSLVYKFMNEFCHGPCIIHEWCKVDNKNWFIQNWSIIVIPQKFIFSP